MKEMKKTLVSKVLGIFGVALLIMSTLAGCGSQAAPNSSSSPTGTSGTSQSAPAQKQTIKLTIGSSNTTESVPWTREMDEFFVKEVSKRVADKTNYQIEWKKVYGGSVAKVGEELQSVQNKLVDISMVVFPYEASKLPLQNFTYWVPFGSPDPEVLTKVLKQLVQEFPALTDVFEKSYNQKLIGLAPIQNYNLVTTYPVSKVEDLKGHKIAAVGPNLHFLNGTGAVPVQSSIPEMYTSFQTKVYEGWIMYPDSLLGSKIYEVAPYLTQTDFGAILLGGITINLNSLKSLPKEVQDIVLQVGGEFTDVMAKYSKDTYESQVQQWQTKGGKFAKFPDEEKAKWINGLPSNILSNKAKEMDTKGLPGSAMLKRYYELLKTNGYTPPKVFNVE